MNWTSCTTERDRRTKKPPRGVARGDPEGERIHETSRGSSDSARHCHSPGCELAPSLAEERPLHQTAPVRWEYKHVKLAELIGDNAEQGLDKRIVKGALLGKTEEMEQKALKMLNRLGAEGWELFSIREGSFFFKRPYGRVPRSEDE